MRKRNKVVSLLLAGCMAAGLLAGCGSSGEAQVATADNATAASTSTGAADSAAPETAGEVDGQINLRAVSFGNNFDVQDMGWRWMMAECYEGLMRDVADENGDRFEYAGAESMDVSDDGLVYTFHLRKDAKWSDGQPVTAADYEYGWKRLLNPEYGYSYSFFLFNVVGAEEYYNGQGSADEIGINMHTVNKAYTVLKQEGFVKVDRRKGAVISIDEGKKKAMEEMRQELLLLLAKASCKNISRQEVHALIDEIYEEYGGLE